MSRRPLVSLLLVAALLAGPVVASAHDSDHGIQEAAHGCVVCVYAHGAGHGALPATLALVVATPVVAPEAVADTAEAALAVRLHPIRGPPALLA